MASSDDETLEEIMQQAEQRRKQLLESDGRQGTKSDFDATVALYARAVSAVSRQGLLSPNEDIDDVATAALRYLLLDLHQAELLQRSPVSSATQRQATLAQARGHYEGFLAVAQMHGLVVGSDAALVTRYREAPREFARARGRDERIAVARAQKSLQAKMEAMQRRGGGGGGGGGIDEYAGVDEESVRELELMRVAAGVHTALDALDGINREEAVLALRPDDDDDDARMMSRDPDSDHREPVDAPLGSGASGTGPLLSQAGKPLRPFTLLPSRTDVARRVFGPGHNLPTMSIDEYLAEEQRRGNMLQGGGAEQAEPAVDEDDVDAVDRETYKARRWDDFKDENPRGSGNTLNMG